MISSTKIHLFLISQRDNEISEMNGVIEQKENYINEQQGIIERLQAKPFNWFRKLK